MSGGVDEVGVGLGGDDFGELAAGLGRCDDSGEPRAPLLQLLTQQELILLGESQNGRHRTHQLQRLRGWGGQKQNI